MSTVPSAQPQADEAQVYPGIPPECLPNLDDLVTEDDTPVDNIFSEKQQRLLTEPLYSSLRYSSLGGMRFVALANVGLFFATHAPPLVPDALLSLDVQVPQDLFVKAHRSYFVWEYGKPPDVVIEVVSNKEGNEDGSKLVDYARIGVKYYVIFDPEQHLGRQLIRAYELHGSGYVEMARAWFAGLGLGLRLWDGPYEGTPATWLRWHTFDGDLVPTGAERADQERERAEQERGRADLERMRAEQERERAQQERERADQERERADRLAEQLRALGVDPTGTPRSP